MFLFILKRIFLLFPTLLGISILVFSMLYFVPGDPAQIMLGERASAQAISELRKELALDQPFYVQFYHFFSNLASGNLGRSIRTHEKVSVEIFQRLPATIELTLCSMLIATLIGITFGVFAAVHRGKYSDFITMMISTAGISLPVFWLALLLILAFSIYIPIFPISGRISSYIEVVPVTYFYTVDAILMKNTQALGDVIWHLVLPSFALGTIPMAFIARMVRASMIEIFHEDFIRTAWAKGLRSRVVVLRHALRNAFIPTLTIIALEFGYLLGGAVITETIFSWPGIGRWLFLSVQARDLQAVQGGVLLIATIFVIINTFADILYAWLDPRIRYNA
ncbi:MAG: ABC transporter permease [Candidatus Latescibacterota bacterium]|nr:ABC transporter permease [Candidatus Latescibacterota bacterium]